MPQDFVVNPSPEEIELCKGSLTVFLGGAGMRGGYNDEFVQVLREAGVCNPVYGNYAAMFGIADGRGILDMLADASAVIFQNQPAGDPMRPQPNTMPQNPTDWINMELESIVGLTDTRDRLEWEARTASQYRYTLEGVGVSAVAPDELHIFNIIGYSWGAAVACRVALYYTSIGLQVDMLALIGAPINPSLLAAVQADGSIANVIVVNLTEFGDPIFAGMSDMGLVANVPALIGQMLSEGEPTGHFHYSGSGTDESLMRKRLLVADLVGQGLQ